MHVETYEGKEINVQKAKWNLSSHGIEVRSYLTAWHAQTQGNVNSSVTEDQNTVFGNFLNVHHVLHVFIGSRTNVHQIGQTLYQWKGLSTYIMNP